MSGFKMFSKFGLTLLLAVFAFSGTAQQNQNKVLDGAFIKETAPTKRVVPYTHIREGDVMYYKRLVRRIDLKQKINLPLYYPDRPIKEIGYVRMPLIEIIRQGVNEGTLTAYEAEDFQQPLTKNEAEGKLSQEITIDVEDPVTGQFITETRNDPITPDKIIGYELKEDWFFDRERSIMEVRIIGMQAIYMAINEDGTDRGPAGSFWIYFPEARYVFANHEVYNPGNDAARITFEDYFRKRIFASYIISETNVYSNRLLEEYTSGIDRLLESRKIEEDIINYEHDMWQF